MAEDNNPVIGSITITLFHGGRMKVAGPNDKIFMVQMLEKAIEAVKMNEQGLIQVPRLVIPGRVPNKEN